MKKKISNIITTVILVLLIVLVAAMFIARASGNSISLFGYSIFRVSSESMVPTLEVGDIILVKSASPDSIQKGDIITYQVKEGGMKGERITHRVVSDPQIKGDIYYYQTQGDAEGAPLDGPMVTDRQVIGKYQGKIPLIDKLYTFFLTPAGLITIIVVIMALFGYEIISLIVSYRAIDKKYDNLVATVQNDTDSLDDQEKEEGNKE